MLTYFEVRNPRGELFTLSLEDDSSGFLVEDIDGLEPVKATLVSSSFASIDGSQYQSSRRENRNLTIRLELSPDHLTETVFDLRNKLYRFFMPKLAVNLRFYMSEGFSVDISGRVESCNPVIFSSEPKVDISIVCFDPDFVDTTPIILSGSTVSTSVDTKVEYTGSVETGFTFALNVDRSLSAFTIYNRLPDNTLQILDFSAPLISGDVLTISTIGGDKSVTRNRAGVVTSLLYGMSPQSSWIEFFPGDNDLRVYATGAAVPYTITYSNRYGGL